MASIPTLLADALDFIVKCLRVFGPGIVTGLSARWLYEISERRQWLSRIRRYALRRFHRPKSGAYIFPFGPIGQFVSDRLDYYGIYLLARGDEAWKVAMDLNIDRSEDRPQTEDRPFWIGEDNAFDCKIATQKRLNFAKFAKIISFSSPTKVVLIT